MRHRVFRFPAVAVCLALLAGAAACGQKASGRTTDVAVTDIDLGRDLNQDRTVKDKADDFHASDVIYLSVGTKGAGPATLQTRWTFDGNQQVAEETRTINPTGPARTEFHMSKPSGLPSGRYRVELLINGAPGGSKEFEVH